MDDLARLVSPEVLSTLKEAEALQEIVKQNKKKMTNRMMGKIFINIFFAVLIIGGLVGAGFYLKSNWSKIGDSATGIVNNIFPPKNSKAAVKQPATSVSKECKDIGIDLSSKKIDIPVMGECYNIPKDYRGFWEKALTVGTNISEFPATIAGENGDVAFVTEALENSLSTWVLDLREPSEEPAPEPTDAPESQTTAPEVVAVKSTPAPLPSYEKQDSPQNLDVILAAMQEIGIRAIMGQSKASKGEVWKMIYDNRGQEDYVTLTTEKMPEACQNAKAFITVSLDPFDGAMQLGTGWVFCK